VTHVNEPHSLSAVTVPEKWLTCNGRQLRKLTRAGLAKLEQNHQEVNDLNVFPVPDGDTGTNMLLTMRAAYGRIKDSEDTHVGRVANELSHGALMGARGNSGVILSQLWRGLAKSLEELESFDANDLATAFTEAADTAYKGVMRPVEGTILTVARECAEEAQYAVDKNNDLRFILMRIIQRSQQSLARTPDLLPILKEAGVVDAGGKGLVYILEGMLGYVQGEDAEIVEQLVTVPIPAQVKAAPAEGLEFPYDVQFILEGENLNVLEIREAIDAMGDSTLVVGDAKTIKVHVHVKDPGAPISFGVSRGKIDDVVVENMQMQMEAIIGAPSVPPRLVTTEEPALQPGQIGIVAVASGDGLAEIFRSLGANSIVNGGQSNNPSTEEIFQAVEENPADRVIILPNNKNIIMAAKAARDLSTKDVAVVLTRTAPQGFSALLTLDRDGELDDAVAAMTAACEHVISGEIAIATRSAFLNGVSVDEGQVIGVVDGRLCVAATNIDDVLRCVLDEMQMGDKELVSIYYGQEVAEPEAQKVASKVQELFPEAELEVLPGGQAIYQYILGAE
jgi:DAK2 domain fusion protein YloV